MSHLQKIYSKNELSKQEQIIEYLKQDNEYWLQNDKWAFEKEFFLGKKIGTCKHLDFSDFNSDCLKNEAKYFILCSFKVSVYKPYFYAKIPSILRKLAIFCKNINSFLSLDGNKTFTKWKLFLIAEGITYKKGSLHYFYIINKVIDFFRNFYDDRDETDRDIWFANNIKGVKTPAIFDNKSLNFCSIPLYYRETVKKYFKTIITKKSWSQCAQILNILNYFFNSFYSNDYNDGFLESLTREDIEGYLFRLNNDLNNKNATYRSKFVSYIRTFLEYIQLAQYEKAPKKEANFLIFQDDIPKRELHKDEVKKARFIPEPIIKQIDSNIMGLDKPQYIPIYILLRETGWRGTDILNLKYDNCLEKIWNKKEDNYNYYLCGEITKTGIALLKIPIRDKVAEIVEMCIKKAKESSTDDNNPKKYLFNIYKGKNQGQPYQKQTIVNSIKRLIEQKDIRDTNGELYHFKMHSLRHTRAKEYVEQGMGISVIQQILGHTSLQMTVHYATVTENVLYEKWKVTQDLDLFKINSNTNSMEQINTTSDYGESLIRYEYVKENLDAVKVPFGVCFKPSKLPCKQQMNQCLSCASFCTTVDNIPEYEDEIGRVKAQIEISEKCGRELWAEKNKEYLSLLEEMLEKIKEQKVVHKNGKSREF